MKTGPEHMGRKTLPHKTFKKGFAGGHCKPWLLQFGQDTIVELAFPWQAMVIMDVWYSELDESSGDEICVASIEWEIATVEEQYQIDNLSAEYYRE